MKLARTKLRRLGTSVARHALGLIPADTAQRRRAALNASTALTKRLTVEALEPRILLSADIAPIAGSIDVPGEVDTFTFNLAGAKKVYFDALSRSPSINWSLKGPNGQVVTSRSFSQSDAFERPGSNVLELGSGDYALTVDGAGDATGAYAFRLLDIAEAERVAIGQTVSARIDAKETDLYRFDAAAGDRIFLDRLNLSGGYPSWRLIGPDGEPLVEPSYFDDSGVLTLGRTGSYTIAVEGRVEDEAFDYSFVVQTVAERREALTIGATVAGLISGPGSTVSYDFELGAATRLMFDALRRNDSFTWSLAGPGGTLVSSRGFASSDATGGNPYLSLGAGRYTLTVAAGGAVTGPFAFRLLDMATATPVARGASFGGSIGDAGVTATRAREAGAPIDYAGVVGTTNHAWRSDGGRTLEVADTAALRPAALTLEAWIRADSTDEYRGAVMKSNSSWSDGYALTVGADGRVRFFVNDWSRHRCDGGAADGRVDACGRHL